MSSYLSPSRPPCAKPSTGQGQLSPLKSLWHRLSAFFTAIPQSQCTLFAPENTEALLARALQNFEKLAQAEYINLQDGEGVEAPSLAGLKATQDYLNSLSFQNEAKAFFSTNTRGYENFLKEAQRMRSSVEAIYGELEDLAAKGTGPADNTQSIFLRWQISSFVEHFSRALLQVEAQDNRQIADVVKDFICISTAAISNLIIAVSMDLGHANTGISNSSGAPYPGLMQVWPFAVIVSLKEVFRIALDATGQGRCTQESPKRATSNNEARGAFLSPLKSSLEGLRKALNLSIATLQSPEALPPAASSVEGTASPAWSLSDIQRITNRYFSLLEDSLQASIESLGAELVSNATLPLPNRLTSLALIEKRAQALLDFLEQLDALAEPVASRIKAARSQAEAFQASFGARKGELLSALSRYQAMQHNIALEDKAVKTLLDTFWESVSGAAESLEESLEGIH